jgi:hypothetical protein
MSRGLRAIESLGHSLHLHAVQVGLSHLTYLEKVADVVIAELSPNGQIPAETKSQLSKIFGQPHSSAKLGQHSESA